MERKRLSQSLSSLTGSDVYVAGWDGGVAEYWKNGVAVPLNVFDGTNGAEAWSIVVSEGDVYVAGWGVKTTPH